ncbi:MAG TPA: amino acid adenylation domain-containing protein [Verrucomicrobiae bacterium]|nr:amino acid adenylation domain-containing protein [Verrucomicrobiae bacterium]
MAEQPGGLLVFSEATRVPMWNHAAWLRGSTADLESFLHAASDRLSCAGRRPVVYVCEPAVEQAPVLSRAGYEKFDQEAWMAFSDSSQSLEKSARVQEVTAEHLDAFVATFSASFLTREPGYARVLRQASSTGAGQVRHFIRHFILLAGGKAVSVGSLITHGDLACLYNVGTPPGERRKGYARELVAHILALAREQHCGTVFLQVEQNSSAQRLYQKFGFQTLFLRTGFRLSEWMDSTQTKLSAALGFRARNQSAGTEYNRETRPIHSYLAHQLARRSPRELKGLYLASWAYLLHRYTGEPAAAFTVGDSAGAKTRVRVEIPLQQNSRTWLQSLQDPAPANEPEAGESLLCLHEEISVKHLQVAECPVTIHVLANQQIELVYRTDLFAKDAIRRMGAHLTTILESLLDRPDNLVGDLEILPPDERRQLLIEWNQSDFEPAQQTFAELFETQVERCPDAIALLLALPNKTGPLEQMTYRQLNRRANRLAHALRQMGVGPEVFVGVFLDRSLEMIVALLAILKAGGACVPLDTAYPRDRLAFMLQDCAAPVVITQQRFTEFLPKVGSSRLLYLDKPMDGRRPDAERNPPPAATGQNAAYLIYTSGSTGAPKGVLIPNQSLADHCLDCRRTYRLGPRDRVLQFSSFNFDASLEQCLPPLISGASVLVRGNEVWSAREFARNLRDFEITVADLPTAYWHQLSDEWSRHSEIIPSNGLRLLIVGGEALSPEKLAVWRKTPLSKVRLINAYGPTEATITATSWEIPCEKEDDAEPDVVSIGRARGGRKIYVLDPGGNPVPIGIPGELYIGGRQLARGYHHRSDLTESRFVPNPFTDEPDARLYRTGDLGRFLEDGNLEFLGRLDDQVKIRGFRVELGEIENCLCQHPAIRAAIVTLRPDISGDRKLVAYFTSESPIHTREITSFLKSKLPDFMVPASIVRLEKLPLLPSGKVDRQALSEPHDEVDLRTINGPRDSLELQLQLLFERVLKRAPVDIHTSFFELGGDSLQALELLVEIQRATGRQLPLGTLYQASTVESLASELTSSSTTQWSSLVPLQKSGDRPPLFLLHTTPGDILGYGNLVYRLGPDQPCYGLQSLGLKEPRLSQDSILEMARGYVELLQKNFPNGPYYLGGWCYGGILAVEMARLLRARGEKVALLALLETVAAPPRIGNYRYFVHRLRCFLRMSPRRWVIYAREKARYTREARIANKMRFRQADPSAGTSGELSDARLAKLEHVYNTNLKALEEYRSSYYGGKVTLFNAAEKDPALIPDPQYGWAGLAREIEIREVPGKHDTMLFEPNVSVLAAQLNACLLQAHENFKS